MIVDIMDNTLRNVADIRRELATAEAMLRASDDYEFINRMLARIEFLNEELEYVLEEAA
jgi:hypothetical protein